MYIGHSETENYLQPTPAVPPHTMHRNNEKRTSQHVSEAPAPQPANPVQEKMRQILQEKQGDVYRVGFHQPPSTPPPPLRTHFVLFNYYDYSFIL